MDSIEAIAERIRNSIIERTRELAREDFLNEEELKDTLISYSLIDATVIYIVFMLEKVVGQEQLKSNKEDFLHEFQSYFTNTLNHHIDFRLLDCAASKKPKDEGNVINLMDYAARQ